jgi:fluoride exporter
MKEWLAVFLGSGLGGAVRFGFSRWIKVSFATGFPWATLVANVCACVIVGFFSVYLIHKNVNKSLVLACTTGFCGGLSTFSTFSNETVQLINRNEWKLATLYVMISFVLTMLATWFGNYWANSYFQKM